MSTTVCKVYVCVHNHVVVGKPEIGRVEDFVEVKARFQDVGLSDTGTRRRGKEGNGIVWTLAARRNIHGERMGRTVTVV
jgi:hypothetical protein